MAINKKLIHFKKFENFNLKKLSANETDTAYTVGMSGVITPGSPDILYHSICWIKDTRQMWTHGALYDCSFTDLSGYQEVLVSGTNIKTINGETILGNGDIVIDKVTENTVSGWGFTKNAGTVTGVKMNGSTKNPSNGVVDLGTVITSHQDISGKLDATTAASTYLRKDDASSTYLGKTAKAADAIKADSATKATQDASGNVITTTYATKMELRGKQDTLTDLDAIRSGAAKGSTALQSVPSEYAKKVEVPTVVSELFNDSNYTSAGDAVDVVENPEFATVTIAQVTGSGENTVMSQKATTDKFNELESVLLDKYIDIQTSEPGYYKLNKTIPSGTECEFHFNLNPWGVYTNIVLYTQEYGTSYEEVRTGIYSGEAEFKYTPSIDVNYIRIDSSIPSSGANCELVIESKRKFVSEVDIKALSDEIDLLKYVGEQESVEGVSGFISITNTLYAGRKYEIRYNIEGYDGQFYFLELANDYVGVQDILVTGGIGQSNLNGVLAVTPEKDVNMIRIGVGSYTPEGANTNIVIAELASPVSKREFEEKVDELGFANKYPSVFIEPYFEEEMNNTINSVNAVTNQRCMVMPVVADNHWRWTTSEGNDVKNRSINNIKYFNSKVYCDGVVHVGDILDTGVIGDTTDEKLYALMQDYLMQLSGSNKNFYAVNGNHDGSGLSNFNELKWYGMIGRATANDVNVNRYLTTPYYYVDHKPTNLRCVFLASPDNVTGDNTYWGFSPRELEWLETEAFKVPSGYNVLVFTHIPPISGFSDSASNISEFITLCQNFNSSNEGKILGVICGHCHVDLVIPTGWTYTGGYSNQLPFPIVLLGTNYYNLGSDDRVGEFGGTIFGRTIGTATEDLWTIVVYTPDDSTKFRLVRFGAGNDVMF